MPGGGPVVEKYFATKPPFGTGNKKSEFPDAFVVNGLVEYATLSTLLDRTLSTLLDRWSGIFGLLVGGGIGIALATVLCGLLALLINIRDLLADRTRHRWAR